MIRKSTISATPKTCHQTDRPLKSETRWLEKTLISPWMIRMRRNSPKTQWSY
jgi:hypothetical protein